jgi:hypothetical protein
MESIDTVSPIDSMLKNLGNFLLKMKKSKLFQLTEFSKRKTTKENSLKNIFVNFRINKNFKIRGSQQLSFI